MRYLALVLTLALAGVVHAEERAGLGFALEADMEFGGDEIATVSFVDGSSEDVNLGDGFTFALGAHYRATPFSPFSVRLTGGYKFVSTSASNADIGVDRMVFELVGNHLWSSGFWIGAGVTHHTSIEFDGDGFGPNLAFEDATGYTAELGWKWVALSYTAIDYTDEFGFDWDGGSIGITFTNKF